MTTTTETTLTLALHDLATKQLKTPKLVTREETEFLNKNLNGWFDALTDLISLTELDLLQLKAKPVSTNEEREVLVRKKTELIVFRQKVVAQRNKLKEKLKASEGAKLDLVLRELQEIKAILRDNAQREYQARQFWDKARALC